MPEQRMTKDQIQAACVRLFANKRFTGRIALQVSGRHEYSVSTALSTIIAEFDTKGTAVTDIHTGHPVCLVDYKWWDNTGNSGGRTITLASFDGVLLYRHGDSVGTGWIMVPEGEDLRVVIFRRPRKDGAYDYSAPVIRNWGVYRSEPSR